ncbi:MAG: PilZ domain-containing protein [Thiolinea sp.]
MEPGKLYLVLSDKAEIHNHYMPMLEGGGIFVPTNDDFDFNDTVVVQVDLLSEKQKASVPGKVVWITPVGAQRGLMKGVGIQFHGEHQGKIQQYFESLIGDQMLQAPAFPNY